MGIVFGSPLCKKCGKKAHHNVSYNVWTRMVNQQIDQEDYILNVVKEKGQIEKEELTMLLDEKYEVVTNALGHLVYYGYLKVDPTKKEKFNCIEYSVTTEKSLETRYELIR